MKKEIEQIKTDIKEIDHDLELVRHLFRNQRQMNNIQCVINVLLIIAIWIVGVFL